MIYADHNGTAPIGQAVKEYLIHRLEQDGPYANPNALHFLGAKCLRGLESARKICADAIKARPDQIIFNSGASEGISTIFHSVLPIQKKLNKKTILISQIEHSATIAAATAYEQEGFRLIWIPTLNTGLVNLEFIQETIQQEAKNLALVVVMAANNETGVIQPYQQIGKSAQDHGVLFCCDTTQIIGKTTEQVEFNFAKSNIDFAVCSGHKLGALPGSGFLLAKHPTLLRPLIFGGGQELNKRGGTQNYIGAETLAVALKDFHDNKKNLIALKEERELFEKNILSALPQIVIFGNLAPRLANTTFLSYPGILGQAVQIELESHNIFITTSSACSDNEPATSKVLKAMGVDDTLGRGAVRISLGLHSDPKEYTQITNVLINAYLKLNKIQSY